MAGAALWCTATLLQAQGVNPSAQTVRDTLGTALVVARRGAAASATPRYQLGGDALRQSGAGDMSAALRRLAAVTLRDYGGAGGLKTVSVRGLGAQHTAVTYDGIPVSDVRAGQTDLGRFTLEGLSEIALTAGDAPDLLVPVRTLGTSTVALRSRAAALGDDLKAWGGSAALCLGSFTHVNPSLSIVHSWRDSTRAVLTTDYTFAANDYPYTLHNGRLTHRERRTNSRMQAATAELSLSGNTARGGAWSAKTYYNMRHRRLPGATRVYAIPAHDRLHEQTAFTQGVWRQPLGRYRLLLGGKWETTATRYREVNAGYPGGALQQNYQRWEGYLMAGIQRRWQWLEAAYALDATHNALRSNLKTAPRAARTDLQQALSLRLHAGAVQVTARGVLHTYRNHRHEAVAARNFTRLAPSLRAAYRLGTAPRAALTLRAFYQETFRPPTFTESYYYHYGSPTLRPEVVQQWGGGATLLHTSRTGLLRDLALTADGYAGRVRDRIVSVPRNLFVWSTTNVGRVHTLGADFTLSARLQTARRCALLPLVNLSLQHAKDMSVPTARSYAQQLPYLPRAVGGASLACETPWIGVALSSLWTSRRWASPEHAPQTDLPPYAEWAVALYRDLPLRAGTLALRLDLQNLFDHQYEIVRGYPMPGRSVKASVRWSW